MPEVTELDGFLEDGWSFRLRGKTYTVREVAWPEYLELARMQNRIDQAIVAGKPNPEDVERSQFYVLAPRVLGPVLDELVADGVGGPTIGLLARSAYFFQLGDKNAAELMLQQAGSGKAETPEETSGSTSTIPTGSTSSESENATRRPASTTGTRSPSTSKKHSRGMKAEPRTAANA